MREAFEVDAHSFDACANKMWELKGKDMKGVCKTALRRGAGLVVREARKIAKSEVPALAKKSRFKGDKGKTYLQGIRVAKHVTDRQAKVHIMGHFLLKIFELGSVQRSTVGKRGEGAKTKRKYKAGVNRGAIAPRRFFARAQENVSKNIDKELDRFILSEVNKRWNKMSK